MLKALLPIILWCATANAQNKPVVASYRDFSGGLNTYSASVSLPVNESPDLMNVVIDEPLGALTQRKGYQACGNIPSGNTATNLYEYSRNSGVRTLIVTDNITIWATSDCVFYSTIATSLTATSLPRFATIQDKLWIVNGSTWPITYDGTTVTMLDGQGGRPTGKIGKYITFWKSRIWIGSLTTNPSGVFFTDIISNGVALDPATSTMAWANALNLIYFNRDDGSPIYGQKVYRDNMYIFKDTGISRLVFQDDFNLSVTKNVSVIGSKFQESIVEMDDGLLRFAGRDGLYSFDGSTVKRISTRWTPTYESIKQPAQADKYNIWDTVTDWIAGTLTNVSSDTIPGSVTQGYEDFSDLNYTANPIWTPISGFDTGLDASSGYLTNINYSGYSGAYVTTHQATGKWEFDLYKTNANQSIVGLMSNSPPDSGTYVLYVSPNNLVKLIRNYFGLAYTLCSFAAQASPSWGHYIITKSADATSIFTVSLSTATGYTTGCTGSDIAISATTSDAFFVYLRMGDRIDNIRNIYKSTGGVYISQISTATGLTVWKTFDTDQTLNGQTIDYQIRTGATPTDVIASAFTTIVPGSIISTTTNTNYQWRANFTTTDNGISPVLNSAQTSWTTGGATKSQLYGLSYKSRYWLSASTSVTNDYNDLVMIESKSPLGTHTRYDLGLSAMTLWNNNLYGAISNTSKIARLDYGDTDDGVAINSYWNSRDEVYENPVYMKTVNVGVVDFSNSPSNTGLNIGLSPNQGATFQDRAVNLSASTLTRNTKKLNYDANTSLGFRMRVSNSVPGIGFKIYGLYNMGTQLDLIGN